MAKTIAELEETIVGKLEMLNKMSKYISKSQRGIVEREVAADRKRIEEMLANRVVLGDNVIAEEGMNVFGYSNPQIDRTTGDVVNYNLYVRTIQGTKRGADGTGYITFQKAEKKFERLTFAESNRFFLTKSAAIQAVADELEKSRKAAEAVLATVGDLLSFVTETEPTIVDLTTEDNAEC